MYAWAPFYYATAREPDAGRVFSAVGTYGIAVLALMTAGLSAVAADLLQVVTHGQYVAAAGIVTWTAVGVFFYGVYLLDLYRSEHHREDSVLSGDDRRWRRPEYWFELRADSSSLASSVRRGRTELRMRFKRRWRFGFLSASIRCATRTVACSRVVMAALIAFVVARMLPAMPAAIGIFVRGAAVVVIMSSLLWATGFFNADEIRALSALAARKRPRSASRPAETTELAGEIVSVEVPEETDTQLGRNS